MLRLALAFLLTTLSGPHGAMAAEILLPLGAALTAEARMVPTRRPRAVS